MSYPISLSFTDSLILTLPSSFSHEAADEIKQAVFGSSVSGCKVDFHDKHEIRLSKDLFDHLHLPLQKTQVFVHGESVYFGPLIGIFTAGFTESILRPVGSRSLLFAKFLTAQRAAGVAAYVFGSHSIDWLSGTVSACVFDDDGWRRTTLPLPNVVYDRLPNRQIEDHRAIQEIKRRLSLEYGIPWFNPGFFDKWTIHKLLLSSPEASAYLPETLPGADMSDIHTMLARCGSVFLKPKNGSLGRGIFQIIYDPEKKEYYSRYRSGTDRNILRKYQSLDAFFTHSFDDRNPDEYVIQQRIKLLKAGKQKMDFRVHTNKDGSGRFQVTAIAAKVAGKGSATTHLENGGAVRTLQELFQTEAERNYAFRSLKNAALNLSVEIDKGTSGHIGEIGFDLGIDTDGAVWMFEANSKPGRSIFSHPDLREADRISTELSLQYAKYLTRKAIVEPETLFT
ncbi:YheC/YheD family protein [Metabacillus indicus]|uniref:YheC/YheD family endospore coat-associated protein n=1 Tax=Metabacillus indicus TaxID=246786 RepID=UPI003983F294